MSRSALRALLRIERRHITKNPGRSLLIVLLVAIPTAAMVGGSALLFTVQPSVEDQRNKSMGLADLALTERPPTPDSTADAISLEEARASLPEGTSTALVHRTVAAIARPGARRFARHIAARPETFAPGGLLSTKVRIEAGTPPTGNAQVAVSRRVLRGLGAGVGDAVTVNGSEATITGVVVIPEQLKAPAIVTDLPLVSAEDGGAAPGPMQTTLLALAEDDAALEPHAVRLEGRGLAVQRRATTGFNDGFEAVLIFVCGSFGFFEAALVIGAAFAVGMRRRQREIGLLASTGADRAPIVRALLTSTAALSLVGAMAGAALGYVTARFIHPHLDAWTGREVGAFHLPTQYILFSCGLGVLASVLSAWLPARAAARIPIRIALSGRRPLERGSLGFLRSGSLLLGLGAALIAGGALYQSKASGISILLGAIVFVLGLGLLSPWILERLARLASPLPLPWRLALRDAGRFRARNGPVITAVIAGMSISVLMGCLVESIDVIRGERQPTLQVNEIGISGASAGELAFSLAGDFDLDPAGAVRQLQDPPRTVVTLDVPVTEEIARDAIEAAAAFPSAFVSAAALNERPELDFFHVVLWVCIVTGLVVIFVATALSSVESAMDARVLFTVGASPTVLRHHMASRAGYLALLGCFLAVPAGLVPMLGLLRLSGGSLPFVMPWSTVALAMVVMPLIAYLGTWSYARVRPPSYLATSPS
ncbi:MAG: ABC transporter permease [Planctomycetota bacterium]